MRFRRGAIFYVYVLFDFSGVPCYVGKGKGERWMEHEKRFDKCTNPMLRALISKARDGGREVPKLKVNEGMREDDAFALEIALIAAIGRRDIGTGPLANLDKGGRGSSENGGKRPPVSAETREKMSAAKRGGKLSEEHKTKIGDSGRGKRRTPEQCQAISNGQRGTKRSRGWWSTPEGREKQRLNNPGNRAPRSPETRAQISESVRALMTPEHRAHLSRVAIDNLTDGKREVLRQNAYRGAEARWGLMSKEIEEIR